MYSSELTELEKVRAIERIWGAPYSSLGEAVDELGDPYFLCPGDFMSNGYWAFPKRYEPELFAKLRPTVGELPAEKLFTKTIHSEKSEMKIDCLKIDGYGSRNIRVVMRGEKFQSAVDPKFISLIQHLNVLQLCGVKFWQAGPNTPLLVDSDRDQSLMVIMPIRSEENA